MYQFVSFSGHPVPLLGPEAYKTYVAAAPPRTHWRRATCEEYGCDGYLYGFVTTVNLATELGQRQHYFLTHDKKRDPSITRPSMYIIKFIYPPGTICMGWESHKVPLERPPVTLVLGGDWRGNPRQTMVRHTRLEHWVEDFGEHQDKLADIARRG